VNWKRRFLPLAVVSMLALPLRAEEPAAPVLFVCEHGSVKSLIASEWFNRMARERGLPLRAVSRGVEPDAGVPAGVAENLRKDGFPVASLAPRRLEKSDIDGASHIVAIGADSPLFAQAKAPVERWSDIPPASTQYETSREAMRKRLEALFRTLAEDVGAKP
jgi:arsenate reductase (thioredoxin)